MGTQVPREEAIFQRKRPSEAAIEGFALANTGEVHSLLSLVLVHLIDHGELKYALTTDTRVRLHV